MFQSIRLVELRHLIQTQIRRWSVIGVDKLEGKFTVGTDSKEVLLTSPGADCRLSMGIPRLTT